METDHQKAFRRLVEVLARKRRDILKHAPDTNNAASQAQKIEELSHLIEAVEAAAKDDRKRLG